MTSANQDPAGLLSGGKPVPSRLHLALRVVDRGAVTGTARVRPARSKCGGGLVLGARSIENRAGRSAPRRGPLAILRDVGNSRARSAASYGFQKVVYSGLQVYTSRLTPAGGRHA